jgi:hypothetical protein
MAKFYTLYDEQPPKPHVEITQPSMADQTFAEECDIHHIIANFNITGIVDSVGAHDPATLQYGDTTLLPDYETACNLVANVNAEFADLPSSVILLNERRIHKFAFAVINTVNFHLYHLLNIE